MPGHGYQVGKQSNKIKQNTAVGRSSRKKASLSILGRAGGDVIARLNTPPRAKMKVNWRRYLRATTPLPGPVHSADNGARVGGRLLK